LPAPPTLIALPPPDEEGGGVVLLLPHPMRNVEMKVILRMKSVEFV
jgi:hypothetical protein